MGWDGLAWGYNKMYIVLNCYGDILSNSNVIEMSITRNGEE